MIRRCNSCWWMKEFIVGKVNCHAVLLLLLLPLPCTSDKMRHESSTDCRLFQLNIPVCFYSNKEIQTCMLHHSVNKMPHDTFPKSIHNSTLLRPINTDNTLTAILYTEILGQQIISSSTRLLEEVADFAPAPQLTMSTSGLYHWAKFTTGNMHKNLVKFGRVVFKLCERTDRQTYSSQYFAPITGEDNLGQLTTTNLSTLTQHQSTLPSAAIQWEIPDIIS